MFEGIRSPALIAFGYVLGSIPFGYLIVRWMKGIDIRDYGSHNIGATNVLRVVGRGPALLTLLGDILKGVAPPLVAASPWVAPNGVDHWLVVATTLAAIVGHAYSAFFYLKERKFARGKAVATGLGAVVGFVLAGLVAWQSLAIIAAVWFSTLLIPKLLTRRFGWVSLSSILAAISMPLAFMLNGAPMPYVVFGIAAALFVVWKHKENLGRLADGVEPRLGEKPPLAGIDKDELSCAFLIHPNDPTDWWQTRRFVWAKPLLEAGLLPLGALKRLSLFLRPCKIDTITGIETADGRKVQVYLITVAWLPEQIKQYPERAVRRAAMAARMAKDLGARCMGLGAYWSVVGNKGMQVQELAPFIPITNGGAYTAGTVKQAVPLVFAKLRNRGIEPAQATAAIVGANGVVGFGICRQLAGRVAKIIMIGTDLERLEKTAAMLRRRAGKAGEDDGVATEVEIGVDVHACKRADIIFTATSNVDPVILPEHVREGAVVYDMGRPVDVHPAVMDVPGVTVIPGGVVRPPGNMRGRVDVHFGPGCIPACMSETILIALDECYDRRSLGEGTKSENIDYFVSLAERLGFEVVDEALRPEPNESAAAVHLRAETHAA